MESVNQIIHLQIFLRITIIQKLIGPSIPAPLVSKSKILFLLWLEYMCCINKSLPTTDILDSIAFTISMRAAAEALIPAR